MNGSSSSRIDVLAFGELLWDLLPHGKVLGGAPANFAFRLTSLGVPVAMVSKVGTDRLGDEALAQLAKLGVETRWVQRDADLSTGTVSVSIDERGNAKYVIHRDVAYDRIEITDELRRIAAQSRAVCFGSLIQRGEASARTLYEVLEAATGATKVVDINLRRECFSERSVRASLHAAHILKLNDEEVAVVGALLWGSARPTAEFCDAVIEEFDLEVCVVTRGAKGVYARQRGDVTVDVEGHDVAVVDTIGAGDAFTAGFMTKYLEGKSIRECCDFGNRLGARVAMTAGGMSVLPEVRAEK
jgi:fructokinase